MDANLNCPSGGSFYACTNGSKFVGCCKSDPCQDGCGNKDLTPASFNAAYRNNFLDQSCPSGGLFYTCRMHDPPFIGCCKSNPCEQEGCPSKDLLGARLSNDASIAADIIKLVTTSSSSFSNSFTSSSSSSSVASSSSTSPVLDSSATATSAPKSEPKLSNGAIAGVAIGGTIALIAIVAVVVALFTRRDRRSPLSEKHPFIDTKVEGTNTGTPSNVDSPAAPFLALPKYDPTMPYDPSSYNTTPAIPTQTSSPAISSLTPTPEILASQWSPPRNGASELAGSEAPRALRRSELYGTEVTTLGFVNGNSTVENDRVGSGSTGEGKPMYKAYRPEA